MTLEPSLHVGHVLGAIVWVGDGLMQAGGGSFSTAGSSATAWCLWSSSSPSGT